ncbi:LysR family transcriptional regulator [Sphingomonas populi]|uniref:LysR family transcriptional regulator n=1 Tax=Sphingomonas populi TaxID=2484750 RepID=A0A4Q6XPH9_9SPHN|nr:LysR family transcriptional regulator [Sphingomonas populi]RZF59244.1 LysR family transcriptional regulator [Sphingomonas populi]
MKWDDLRFFLEVARTGKMTGAARRLTVEHSTVSRRMQSMEADAGTPLFTRGPSGFKLTEAGEKLLPRAVAMEQAFAGIERSLSNNQREVSGLIRIGSSEAYGAVILPQHLTQLTYEHPQLNVQLLALPKIFQLPRNEVDIVISIDRPERGPYLTVKLADYVLRLYASEDYLARTSTISSLDDLQSHRFVSYVDDFAIAKSLPAAQPLLGPGYIPIKSTSILSQRSAAVAGAGLAILPSYLVTQDVPLQAVLSETVRFHRTYWMAMPLELKGSKRVRLVWQFLRQAALAERGRLAE